MILVLGGTRSGKSSLAARLAERETDRGTIVYLATSYVRDEETRQRVHAHRVSRPEGWVTIEEPLDPAAAISGIRDGGTVILDCITSWLTNVIAPLGDRPDRNDVLTLGNEAVITLIDAIRKWEHGGGETILVSNLVELGLISAWPLGRCFQDLSGETHQRLAAAARSVYHVTAGIPVKIKGHL